MDTLDVLIVGAGPAGIAVGATLQDAGLRVALYDKGALAEAVTQWPIYMEFFSTAENVSLPGMPMILTHEKPTREEYLNYLRRYVAEKKLPVVTGHSVENIKRVENEARFQVSGVDEWGETFTIGARNVVVATGAYEIPKLMNVPGEELHKVSHYYKEVHPYVGKDVLVVGGRNGAAEAALLFYRAGARVSIAYRRPQMAPLKWWLEPDLDNRIKNGEITAYFNSNVLEIRPHDVVLEMGGRQVTIANDFVVAMTGYRPETGLLQNAGVVVDAETNRPQINPETLETNVPGLFVAGVIAAGDISNEIFIENSRTHGFNILQGIEGK